MAVPKFVTPIRRRVLLALKGACIPRLMYRTYTRTVYYFIIEINPTFFYFSPHSQNPPQYTSHPTSIFNCIRRYRIYWLRRLGAWMRKSNLYGVLYDSSIRSILSQKFSDVCQLWERKLYVEAVSIWEIAATIYTLFKKFCRLKSYLFKN